MPDNNSSPSRFDSAVSASGLRSLGRRFSSIIILLVILGLLFAGLVLWRNIRLGGQQGWAQGPLPVTATVVEPREVPAALDAVGTLRAVNEVMLAPEASGRVVDIEFEAGDTVEKDALLVQLFDAPERADLASAKAALTLAQTQLKRSQRLASTGVDSKERRDQRAAQRDQAAAAVERLEAHIRQKQIRAPFAGKVGIRRIDHGQYLNAGEEVATLTALDTLFVEFALPQQDLSRIKTGATVDVKSDAWPERTFTAKVNAIEPQIGKDTRNVSVQAVLDNKDGALRPGMYVTASLALPPQQNALVVPETAIMTSAQGDSIAVVRGKTPKEGGTADIVPVISGRRIGNEVVVTRGLVPGDVVVTDGQLRIQPGASLEVKQPGSPQEK